MIIHGVKSIQERLFCFKAKLLTLLIQTGWSFTSSPDNESTRKAAFHLQTTHSSSVKRANMALRTASLYVSEAERV